MLEARVELATNGFHHVQPTSAELFLSYKTSENFVGGAAFAGATNNVCLGRSPLPHIRNVQAFKSQERTLRWSW